MAIRWMYDDGHVAFGIEWNWEYKAVGKITVKPQIYRYDSQSTNDGTSFTETLDGSESYTVSWGSGGGTRLVDEWREMTYTRRATDYYATMRIQTTSGFGTWYNGSFHTVGALDETATLLIDALPPDATTLSVSGTTTNSATLSWTTRSGNINAICIERRVNGGSWGEVQVIWDRNATSWTDTALALGNTYDYRFRFHHQGAYGGYSNTVSVTTAPTAPTSIDVVAAGDTDVSVTLGNDSAIATGIVWQWSPNKDDESSWSASTAVSGSPVTSFIASGVTGRAYIRVANTRDGIQSGWIVSEQVITITPPNPPTPKSPNGGVASMSSTELMFTWDLNILDRTAPTAYDFRYRVKASGQSSFGSWVATGKTASSTANSHAVAMSTFSAGSTIEWQARTWAAATTGGSDGAGGSEWSSTASFVLHTVPTIEIISPNNIVNAMPIRLIARLTDAEGFGFQWAKAILRDASGIVYPANKVPAQINNPVGQAEFVISSSDFLPDNNATYTAEVNALSESGLSATASTQFTVRFQEPVNGTLAIVNDRETGYVSLTATFRDAEEYETAAENISVSRVNQDGSLTPIITEGASGAGAVDMYAPLNTTYKYAVATQAESKAVSTVYVENIIRSDKAFFYFGNDMATARWNQSYNTSYSRPEQEELRFSGRELPVLTDDVARGVSGSASFTLLDREETEAFKRLMSHSGSVIYKPTDGDVIHARVSVSLSRTIDTVSFYQQQVSVSYTQVDGVRL